MPRFALFTAECAQLGDALTEIVTRHHQELALVLTSDFTHSRGGLLAQTRVNLRRSGPCFVNYLTQSFLAYPLAIGVDRLLARLRGGRRVRRSVTELCAQHGITHIRTRAVNTPEVLDRLRAADVDFIVVYWFDQILHESVISIPRRAVINVHAAYLPGCRGLFPALFSALERGQPFGITAHLIENREIDAGPILAQRLATPPAGRSVIFYDSWVNRVGVEVLDEVLADFDGHLEGARPQAGGSYHSYPTRQEMAEARRRGLALTSVRDFLAAVKGTGAAVLDPACTGNRPGERVLTSRIGMLPEDVGGATGA